MTTRAFFRIAFLGLLTLAMAPGMAAAAGQGQDVTEMLASNAAVQATAVSGPVIEVSRLALIFGLLDNGTSTTRSLLVTNIGDQTLHISSLVYSDGAYSSGGSGGSTTLAPGAGQDITITFAPTDGQTHNATLTIMSDASNGTQTVQLIGQANAEPVLAAIGDKTVTAFTPLNFTVTATDANDTVDDVLTFQMGSGLPPSATFDGATGEFAWTPTDAESGNYTVTFSVSDNRLSDSETIHIAVTVTNHPPVANAGGTYFGATNRPVQFNGGGSSDPDAGQTLSYAWDFGDGKTANGASPMHTYLIPGSFIATVNVCDNGTPQLCDADFAAVTIQTEIDAQILLVGGSSTMDIKKTGNRTTTVGIEEVLVPYTDLIPTTFKISHTGPPGFVADCTADQRYLVFGDLDADGVTDFDTRFTNKCLANLFNNVPNNSTATVVITGQFQAPGNTIPLHAERALTILVKHRTTPILVVASPNPFNPETSISYTVRNDGPVTMRIYSVSGRLVRTLKDGESTVAGTHEVRWNGINEQGRYMPSGIYFVKTSQKVGGGEEASVYKVALTK